MKKTYPIVLTPDTYGFIVYIPDFDINTQGHDLTEAIEMARDAIGLMGIVFEDDGRPIPDASDLSSVKHEPEEIVSLVDIDFVAYRKKDDMRFVKKNCTLPNRLCREAELAGLNFSQVLQSAIKRELNIGRDDFMIIEKDSKSFTVSERPAKWIVSRSDGKLTVTYEVSKELCADEAALKKYVAENDIL